MGGGRYQREKVLKNVCRVILQLNKMKRKRKKRRKEIKGKEKRI
jgi:hypothetical protein